MKWLLVMWLLYPDLPGYEHQRLVIGQYEVQSTCEDAKYQVKAQLDEQFPGNTTTYECILEKRA